MLLALALFCYAWVVTYVAGHAVFLSLEKLSNGSSGLANTTLVHIAGLAGLCAPVSILHLFLPVAGLLHGCIMTLLGIYVLLLRKKLLVSVFMYWQELRSEAWLILLLLLAAVISITARTGTGDIADYHLQAIKWAEHYKNILGLGNFNKPLANNYWWFNLQAFFGFQGVRSVYVMNALLYVSVFIFIYQQFLQSAFKWFYLCLLLFLVFSVKTAFIGAVTPDVYINYITFVLFALVISPEHNHSSVTYYLVVLLMVFSITVKITSVMLGALFIYYSIIHIRLYKNEVQRMLYFYGAVFLLFIVPWIAGNIIQSGYVFPLFNHVDLVDVDWKVPGTYFDKERMVITHYSKLPFQDPAVTARLGLAEWVPLWFMQFDLFNKILLVLLAASLVMLLFSTVRTILRKKATPGFFVLWCAVAGFFLMFYYSPQMRFMFGYIVVIIGLTLQQVFSFPARFARSAGMVLISCLCVLSVLRLYGIHRQYGLPSVMIIPPAYPGGLVKAVNWGNEVVYITDKNNTCWDTFPCTYYLLEHTVMRGDKIVHGFRNEGPEENGQR